MLKIMSVSRRAVARDVRDDQRLGLTLPGCLGKLDLGYSPFATASNYYSEPLLPLPRRPCCCYHSHFQPDSLHLSIELPLTRPRRRRKLCLCLCSCCCRCCYHRTSSSCLALNALWLLAVDQRLNVPDDFDTSRNECFVYDSTCGCRHRGGLCREYIDRPHLTETIEQLVDALSRLKGAVVSRATAVLTMTINDDDNQRSATIDNHDAVSFPAVAAHLETEIHPTFSL